MKTKFFLTAPDEQEFTIAITMPLKKWKELRDQIGEGYPGWEFRRAISECVFHAAKHFAPEIKENGGGREQQD